MHFTLSCIVFIDAALALYPNPYGNPTGDILLCIDNSCQTNAYVNEWIMGGDFCSVLPPDSSYGTSPYLGSYLVTLRPTCNNGSYADWATYGDIACSKEKIRMPYNNDDKCESFAGVVAVAFICDGFVGPSSSSRTSSVHLQTISSIFIATASLVESLSGTAPQPTTSSSSISTSSTHSPSTITTPSTTSSSSAITSAAISSSVSITESPQNSTTIRSAHSSPSAVSTAGAGLLFVRSGYGFLALPACLVLGRL